MATVVSGLLLVLAVHGEVAFAKNFSVERSGFRTGTGPQDSEYNDPCIEECDREVRTKTDACMEDFLDGGTVEEHAECLNEAYQGDNGWWECYDACFSG